MERALLLKEVLDRVETPPFEDIPGAEAVAEAAKTDEKLSSWTLPQTEIEIARVQEGPRAGEFLFTPETVGRLEDFYAKVKHLPYKAGASEGFYDFYTKTPGRLCPPKWAQWLPGWTTVTYLDQTVWQWAALVLLLPFGFLVPYEVRRRWRQRAATASPVQRAWRRVLIPVSAAVTLLGISYVLDEEVNITGAVLLVKFFVLQAFIWLSAIWAVFLIGNAVAETIIASPRINPRGVDASLIRTFARLVSLFVAAVALAQGIAYLGMPLIPILTGLGVGGLALALAARPTIENLIGGLVLFADRPVAVGEFCRFGDKLGVVEEIGLRSTRIRGLDRTLISVPNSEFAQMQLINYAKRDRMLLKMVLGLRYETTPEQLRFVLAKLRELLLAHPKVTDDPARVRLVGFGAYSLDLEIFAYVISLDWSEFLGIREDILLRIMNIVTEAGTGFAFPSQTTYLSQDSGLGREEGHAAESQVQAWRSEGALPFPEFPDEHRREIRNTLDFPPAGSPDAHPSGATNKD